MARPLGSTRITGLLSYYGTVRHCLLDLGTLPLADWPLVGSPSHDRTDQLRPWPDRIAAPRRSFTRSTLAPEPGSRRLYAGCRLGSNQVAPKLVPRPVASSVSTSLGASRRVIGGSLSSVFTGSHLTPSTGAFSATLTTPAVVPAQLAVVWSLLLIGDSGGPSPITNAAPCRVLHLHQSHLPGSRRNQCRRNAHPRGRDSAHCRQSAPLNRRRRHRLAGQPTMMSIRVTSRYAPRKSSSIAINELTSNTRPPSLPTG